MRNKGTQRRKTIQAHETHWRKVETAQGRLSPSASLSLCFGSEFSPSCGTHPAGPAPLALGEQQRGALEDCPGGSPVLPATHQSREQGQHEGRRDPPLWFIQPKLLSGKLQETKSNPLKSIS